MPFKRRAKLRQGFELESPRDKDPQVSLPAPANVSRPLRGFHNALARDLLVTVKSSGDPLTGVVCMWEQLRPADIERAKRRLTIQRGDLLRRHAEELKTLDAEQTEVDTFERLVAAFAEKHLAPSASEIAATGEMKTPGIESGEPSTPDARHEQGVPPRLQVHHQASPNFGVPFRRLVGG
jgi:hypothetical protein